MIKLLETITEEDSERLAEIWLKSNLEAHAFVDKNYWLTNYQAVKEMLPAAKIYAYYAGTKLVGFLGLIEEYIAGIFVLNDYRSMGIGTQLLDRAKSEHAALTLKVYQKNEQALQFYLHKDFKIIEQTMDSETNQFEWLMKWTT